jgi:hypothetical protein
VAIKDEKLKKVESYYFVQKKGTEMGVPSKANIGKLDNPAWLTTNHPAVTELGVSGGND